MRAVVCNEIGLPKNLQVEERDDLVAGPGEVVIDVVACGVNFVDALMVQGLYQVKPEPPFVPGSEVAGTVSQIGEGVTGVSLGDRVVAMPGMNGFAEQVGARAGTLLAVPTNSWNRLPRQSSAHRRHRRPAAPACSYSRPR